MLQADPRSVYRKVGGGAAAAEEEFTLYLDCLDVKCAFRPPGPAGPSVEVLAVIPTSLHAQRTSRRAGGCAVGAAAPAVSAPPGREGSADPLGVQPGAAGYDAGCAGGE